MSDHLVPPSSPGVTARPGDVGNASTRMVQSDGALIPLLLRAFADGHPAIIGGGGADELFKDLSRPGWRLVCRSTCYDVQPIVDERSISMSDFFHFVERLIATGWQCLPSAHLMEAHLACSRRVFFSDPKLPVDASELRLLWLAQQGGASALDYMMVVRWVFQMGIRVRHENQWHALHRRAAAWHRDGQVEADPTAPWYFYCDDLDWRGYRLVPLRTVEALWDEGDVMSHCLFDLRQLCSAARPSRFFSVRRDGKRVATLELSLVAPEPDMVGLNRIHGRWVLIDCRLSANRVPSMDLLLDMLEFGNQYDVWSHRPGRAERLSKTANPKLYRALERTGLLAE